MPREVVALVSADDVVAAIRVHADRVHDLLRRSGCGVDESVEVCEHGGNSAMFERAVY